MTKQESKEKQIRWIKHLRAQLRWHKCQVHYLEWSIKEAKKWKYKPL